METSQIGSLLFHQDKKFLANEIFFIVSVCFVRVIQEFFFLVFISIHVSATKATLTVKYFLNNNNYYINITNICYILLNKIV